MVTYLLLGSHHISIRVSGISRYGLGVPFPVVAWWIPAYREASDL